MALENLKRGSLALELRHCERTGYVFRAKKRALIFSLFFLVLSLFRLAIRRCLSSFCAGDGRIRHVPCAVGRRMASRRRGGLRFAECPRLEGFGACAFCSGTLFTLVKRSTEVVGPISGDLF